MLKFSQRRLPLKLLNSCQCKIPRTNLVNVKWIPMNFSSGAVFTTFSRTPSPRLRTPSSRSIVLRHRRHKTGRREIRRQRRHRRRQGSQGWRHSFRLQRRLRKGQFLAVLLAWSVSTLENRLLECVSFIFFVSMLQNCLKFFMTTRHRFLIILWSQRSE